MKKIWMFSALTATSCLLFAETQANDAFKVINIGIPGFQFEGTPMPPLKYPNLEERRISHPKIMVPSDVTNIALKKPVTASDSLPLIGELSDINDGIKKQRTVMELIGGLQWVQIDLLSESEIFAIAIWHWIRPETAVNDVVIQASNDPSFKKNVRVLYNTDYDNSSGLGAGKDKSWIQYNTGKLIEMKPSINARYVRFHSNGNTINEINPYIEIEIYGRKVSVKNLNDLSKEVEPVIPPLEY